MEDQQESKVEIARKFGIDVSLLYENLKLSPTERLRNWQSMLDFVEGLRRARRIDETAARTNS